MGTHPIKFLLLNRHELSYEVLIRGGEENTTVLKLRSQINKLGAMFPSDDIQESGIDSDVDLEGVTVSFKELVVRIKALQDKYDTNLFERTKALANHMYYRFSRMDKTNILDRVNKLQKEFNSQYKILNQIAQATSSVTMPAVDQTTTMQQPTDFVACDKNHISDLQNIKYDGNSCVHVFIQRVNEFCTSRSISPKKFLIYATEIFVGNALHWYRSVRNEVSDWESLTKLLIADFGQFDFDYRLLSEIRRRTQGDTENIVIYLAIMSEYFSRLTKPVSESEKLEILLHNIRPCYANVLAAHGSEIESLCRNFENIQALTAQFREPPRATMETLAPDLAHSKIQEFSQDRQYSGQNYVKKNNYPNNAQSFSKQAAHKTANSQTSGYSYIAPVAAINAGPQNDGKRYCPRCRTDTHNLRQCQQERYIICFKCGMKDVKYPDCTKCNPKSSSPKN